MVQALILAAGKATRMRPYSEEVPKSLFELAPGLTVMDLLLWLLEELGVSKVVVVTRKRFKDQFERRYGNRVVLALVEEGDFGNLYSMSVGMDLVEGDFLLLMSDHIMELDVLKRLIKGKGDKAITLCLDRNPNWEKLKEGLKVVVREGRVEDAGKQAPPYYGIDTGAFYCKPQAKELVRRVLREKGRKAKVEDLLREAIKEGEVGYVDVTGLKWMDIDTPEELAEARKLLPKILRRSLYKEGDGPVSRYVNRPISTRASVWLYLRGAYISPNLVSVVSFMVAILASYLLIMGQALLSALLIQLSSIMDGIDGELARLYRVKSRFGGALDSFLDRYADLSYTLAVALREGSSALLTGVASANVFLVSYVSKFLEGFKFVPKLRKLSLSTRDVRILLAALFVAIDMGLVYLYYMAFVPIIFTVVALTLAYAKQVKRAARKLKRGKPKPIVEVPEEREEEEKAVILISSTIRLILILLLLRGAYLLTPDMEVNLDPLIFTTRQLIDFLELMVVIYFGYRILDSFKYFLNIYSERLVEKLGVTEVAFKRVMFDLMYLILFSLVLYYIPERVRLIPEVGPLLEKALALVVVVIVALIGYDLLRTFYRTIRGAIEEVLQEE